MVGASCLCFSQTARSTSVIENCSTASVIRNPELSSTSSAGGGGGNRYQAWKEEKCNCFSNWPCFKEHIPTDRTVWFGKKSPNNDSFPKNAICNQKYTLFTFLPKYLFIEFSHFFNMYYLLICLSQLPEMFRVGPWYTYWLPLIIILTISGGKEVFDEVKRVFRDREVNGAKYRVLRAGWKNFAMIRSDKLLVGDIIDLRRDDRIPADMILLRTTDKNGSVFIKTDQLDGETDWKLKLAPSVTQGLQSALDLPQLEANVYAEAPRMDIHKFVGTMSMYSSGRSTPDVTPLTVENILWGTCVLASSDAICLVVYTGGETRSVMNTSKPTNKFGLMDLRLNSLTKILFLYCCILTTLFLILRRSTSFWVMFAYGLKSVVILSTIVPIALRVNTDMAKLFRSYLISRDEDISGTAVRTTTIPEQLGRIEMLLSDKTGTLTQNLMTFKKLHLGVVSYSEDSETELRLCLEKYFSKSFHSPTSTSSSSKMSEIERVGEAVLAIALCHNVTPVIDEITGQTDYQASSPDEIALVQWTEKMGVSLIDRTLSVMRLRLPDSTTATFTILNIFPFTSETKRMGIILKNEKTNEIHFLMKGADMVMTKICSQNDWLDEEVSNMAREGLRTLVVAKRKMTENEYDSFLSKYSEAQRSIADRSVKVRLVIDSIETGLQALCLTGVEDLLQVDVRITLEKLKIAGIKVWMLTGDKLETAACIAQSSRLVSISGLHYFNDVKNREEANEQLNQLRRKTDGTCIISGSTLQHVCEYYEEELAELMCLCPSVVVCRCSPTNKADIVRLLKKYTNRTIAAIGDGGNDVSMIQAADVGIGIVGKEGKQASLASDFSIQQFKNCLRLFLVHGRYAQKTTANLALFIFHRGLAYSVIQALFSSFFNFTMHLLFPGLMQSAYSVVFTAMPVFSLVLGYDITADMAMKYPELYRELTKGRELSFKRFFVWTLISIFQGATIIICVVLISDNDLSHLAMVTFTALLISEFIMVLTVPPILHWAMFVSEIVSIIFYVIYVFVAEYIEPTANIFDKSYFNDYRFWLSIIVVTALSALPLVSMKILRQRFTPSTAAKLAQN